jgi:hypothetical protein
MKRERGSGNKTKKWIRVVARMKMMEEGKTCENVWDILT